MKKQSAWALWLAAGAFALEASSGCTLTIDGGDGGDDGPMETAGRLPDASIADADADTGNTVDSAALPDTAPAPEAGDTGSCTAVEQVSIGSTDCDTCAKSSCCDETRACFAGAESVCAELVSCLADCLAGSAEAGIAPGDTASCSLECEGPDGGQPTFESFVSCLSGSCSTQCQ